MEEAPGACAACHYPFCTEIDPYRDGCIVFGGEMIKHDNPKGGAQWSDPDTFVWHGVSSWVWIPQGCAVQHPIKQINSIHIIGIIGWGAKNCP